MRFLLITKLLQDEHSEICSLIISYLIQQLR